MAVDLAVSVWLWLCGCGWLITSSGDPFYRVLPKGVYELEGSTLWRIEWTSDKQVKIDRIDETEKTKLIREAEKAERKQERKRAGRDA